MNRIRWYGPTVAVLLAALMVMLLSPRLTRQLAFEYKATELRTVRNALAENNTLAQLTDAFQQVAVVVEPSVVSITVLTRREMPRRRFGRRGAPDPRWFRGPRSDQDQDNDRDDMERYNRPLPASGGSGWVFDQQGHIVTNNHVVTYPPEHVELVDEIRVRFADGSEHDASVVGTDPKTDIAVLKIKGNDFHPATLAPDPVQQGEIVFAFGSPLGYNFSMSQGIVSAKGRQVRRIGYEDFIQTDAAINPGNSGGPLTDIYGRVVGMNTIIASRTGTYSGLGFAVPADILRHVVALLIEKGEVTRGYLGVEIDELPPKLAQTYGYDGKGVLVVEPKEGTPAAKAGIKTNDIITEVNGEAVEDMAQLRFRIGNLQPGTSVKLKLFRDGKTLTRTLELMAFPEDDLALRRGRPAPDRGAPEDEGDLILRKLGFTAVRTFTQDMADEAGVDFSGGVLVQDVRSRSIAASVGLGPRTIITHVMKDRVRTVAELVKALEKYAPGDTVRVEIRYPDRGELRKDIRFFELPEE